MRKYQRAAVVVAMLGSVSFLGAGVGHAGDGDGKVKFDNKQNVSCAQNDSYQGLIQVESLPIGVGAILGMANQDASESESQGCGATFSIGGKGHGH